MHQCPISNQTDTYKVLAYVEHSKITHRWSHTTYVWNKNYPWNEERLKIARTSTNITLVGHAQQVRPKTKIKSHHTFILKNTSKSINAHKWNKTIENWDKVKYSQLYKHPNKRDYNK